MENYYVGDGCSPFPTLGGGDRGCDYCRHCGREISLRGGRIVPHGPLAQRCAGSHLPPEGVELVGGAA